MSEVAPGVWCFSGSRTNFCLLVEGRSLTLVDTGYPRDLPRVLAAIERVGRSPADVEAIVLTHAHVDHMGSAEVLRRRCEAPVHSHVDEAAAVRGEVEERISTPALLRGLWHAEARRFLANVVRAGGIRRRPVPEVTTFPAGHPLDVPGAPVPIATPGHTSGHCAFALPRAGALLTGDALVTTDPLRGITGPRLLAAPLHADPARARASLRELATVDAEVLVPGHGPPHRSTPAAAVAAALAAED